jgi:hypothetical protein
MAKLEVRPRIDVEIVFSINESEARALYALSRYGDDTFISVFEKLGNAYMREHEQGLRSFLESIHGVVGVGLQNLDAAKRVFDGVTSEKKVS